MEAGLNARGQPDFLLGSVNRFGCLTQGDAGREVERQSYNRKLSLVVDCQGRIALLDVAESPNLLNPESGWLYNSNNAPWSAAGPSSRRRIEFPRYVDNGTESARGLHAIRVLENRKDFTLETLRQDTKTVGVISHVDLLKERIATQILPIMD